MLGASLLFTAAASLFVALGASETDDARFQNAVQGAEDRITGRLEIYLANLRGAAALFAASDSVTVDDFRAYTGRIDVQRRYPGIQGIGWSERVATDLPRPIDERHAIRYLEPQDARNRAALGFDMYSEETRREAMRRARDRGDAALSGRVTLVQEIFGKEQAGFLLYLPVYRGGDIPVTVAARRRLLQGFVYSPFRADDLFAGVFGTERQPRVSFQVYDGYGVDPARLLHASHATEGHRPDLTTATTFEVAGRPWTVVYGSEPAFEAASSRYLIPAVAVAGLLVSILLFGLAWGQARARRVAEQANQAKSDFLSAMSHELRTPLNAIAGYVDLLDLGVRGSLNDAQLKDLGRIKRAQEHLLTLINDVLHFAKLEAGRLEMRKDPVRLAPLLEELGSLIDPQVGAKDLVYERTPVDPALTARGDSDRIRQILLNLLSNAVKFTPAGGRIRLSAERVDGRVMIRVHDTGPGIPPGRLRDIFDPFVQVDRRNLAVSQQGVGLGLAISRELAVAMDGELSVTSLPGEGSTFRLYLPDAST